MNQNYNNDKCSGECKHNQIWEKDYILNPSSCKNSKCLPDDLVITCDEIIDAKLKLNVEKTKTIPKKLNKKI